MIGPIMGTTKGSFNHELLKSPPNMSPPKVVAYLLLFVFQLSPKCHYLYAKCCYLSLKRLGGT